MTPQDQEFTHQPEIGQHGDCQRAVIASLLDLSISEVPHFAQLANGDSDRFYELLQNYLFKKGYVLVSVKAEKDMTIFGHYANNYHFISGPSASTPGCHHVVVGINGHFVFDPNPNTNGLAGTIEDWQFDFLIATPMGGYKFLRDTTQAERSYSEDFSHENGSYHNTCMYCGRGFLGHKRRVICKVCINS